MTDQGHAYRTALVTGASRRIGRAIALDLAAGGWSVGVHYGSLASAADAKAVCAEIESGGGKAVALIADLADTNGTLGLVADCQSRLGPVTCLINNASLFLEDNLQTLDSAMWDRQFAVNLKAPVLLAKAFSAHLPAGLAGNIINIIDQRVLSPTPEFLSYSLAKAGLYTATRMLAQELAPRVRVNAIGPGPVLASIYQSAEAFDQEVKSTLLGRPVPTSEIAAAVRFILDASSMTGQMIALDAGQHLAPRTVTSSGQD